MGKQDFKLDPINDGQLDWMENPTGLIPHYELICDLDGYGAQLSSGDTGIIVDKYTTTDEEITDYEPCSDYFDFSGVGDDDEHVSGLKVGLFLSGGAWVSDHTGEIDVDIFFSGSLTYLYQPYTIYTSGGMYGEVILEWDDLQISSDETENLSISMTENQIGSDYLSVMAVTVQWLSGWAWVGYQPVPGWQATGLGVPAPAWIMGVTGEDVELFMGVTGG